MAGSRDKLGVADVALGHASLGSGEEDLIEVGDELERMRRELEAARRELDTARLEAQGFAQMSHEIRTLLGGVLGISGLLLATELASDQREYARRIRTSGEALLSILNDVRDLSQMEMGALEIEPIDFDLRRAIEEVGEVLAERARDEGTELVVVLQPDVPWVVRGDAARLRQILLSLATFAIRACPGGEVAVRAALSPDAGIAARVRFEVRYDPRPGDNPSTSGLLGGGLGIAIAKRLVDAMGGEIGAASEPGRGCWYWFVLPLARRGRSTDRGLIPRIDLAGRRVLVVDDSQVARDAVREMVEMIGMTCDAAASRAEGAAALAAAAARGEPYDVAILEEGLHEAGDEAPAEALVEAALAAQTHVIRVGPPGALAGHGDGALLLSKPIRATLLYARLLSLLGAPAERVPAVRAAIAPARREATPESPRSRSRILVVEDDVTNQKVATFMVERRGYRVDVVSSGRAAVDAVLRGGYAAVLMDCQMPHLDGYSAAAEIRRREAEGGLRRTPILGMSAHVGAGVRERCLAAGMDDYLSTPLVPEEIDRLLRAWSLAARSGAYEAVRPGAHASPSPTPPPVTQVAPSPPADEGIPQSGPVLSPPAQRAGEPDIVAEVMRLLLTEAPEKVGSMRDAVARTDLGELGRLARELHEGAGALGLFPLQNLSARLERQARSGTLESVVEAVSAIEQEVERARLALSPHRRRGPA